MKTQLMLSGLFSGLLIGCGGSGSSDDSAPADPPAETTPPPTATDLTPTSVTGAQLETMLSLVTAGVGLRADGSNAAFSGHMVTTQNGDNQMSYLISTAVEDPALPRIKAGKYIPYVVGAFGFRNPDSTTLELGIDATIFTAPENAEHAKLWKSPLDANGQTDVRLETSPRTFNKEESINLTEIPFELQKWSEANASYTLTLQKIPAANSAGLCSALVTIDVKGRTICSVWALNPFAFTGHQVTDAAFPGETWNARADDAIAR